MYGESHTENTDISTINHDRNTHIKNENSEDLKDSKHDDNTGNGNENENGSEVENEVENEVESDVDDSLLAEKLMVSDVVPVLTNIYDLPGVFKILYDNWLHLILSWTLIIHFPL